MRVYYHPTGTILETADGIFKIDDNRPYIDIDYKINPDDYRVNTQTMTLEKINRPANPRTQR